MSNNGTLQELNEALWGALGELAAEDQLFLMLTLFMGLGMEDISGYMKITPQEAQARTLRALQQLRNTLAHDPTFTHFSLETADKR